MRVIGRSVSRCGDSGQTGACMGVDGDWLLPSPSMTWRSWRGRMLKTPLLLLLSATFLAFIIGVLTSTFLSDIQAARVSARNAREGARNRLLPVDFIDFQENCTGLVDPGNVTQVIFDNIFDGASPYDNFPSAEVSLLLRKKRIKGWGDQDPVFERLMREVRPRVIVELGSFLGASAIRMGLMAKNLSLDSVILCVDDFRGWPGFRTTNFKDIKLLNGNNMLYYQFMKNIQFKNLTEIVIPVPFSTTAALMSLCKWGILPDLIEVDAAHDFHSTWLDLNWAFAVLRPGGVMFGHDYYNRAHGKGVGRAVDLFAKLKHMRVEPDGKHWILREL